MRRINKKLIVYAISIREKLDDDFILPLNISIGTLIDQRYVDKAYAEAASYPNGSRERKAFLTYAYALERRLEQQNRIDKKESNDKR